MTVSQKKRHNTHWQRFLGFLIFGILFGFLENIIALRTAVDAHIDLRAILLSLMVVIPFSAIGELIVDRVDLLPKRIRHTHRFAHHIAICLEFFIFGIVMGIVEDLIVIGLFTGAPITLDMVTTVTLITIPFAIFGELIVDRRDWMSWVKTESKRSIPHIRLSLQK